MEIDSIRNSIISYATEAGYFPKDYPDIITFNVGSDTIGASDTIFVEVLTKADWNKDFKNVIIFSGIGIPFNPLLETEKTKAISLLRGNTTMRTIGYWGIQYISGTYWTSYFVDVYEDSLNKETFEAIITNILSAKENFEKIIEKPFHIN